jgi:hypothetical protein
MIDRLADRSLSAALAHAQNRAEALEAGGLGDELTIDRDISVVWSPRVNLAKWVGAPTGRPGDTPPNKAGQWLYKFFLGADRKPLYVGRVTGRGTSLVERIQAHRSRGKPISGLTAAGVLPLITANKAKLRAKAPGARSESQLIADILASLPASIEFSFAEVKRLDPRTGKPKRAYAADTAFAEKRYHRKGAARINTRDNPRFEEEIEADLLGANDPGLANLVRRVAAALSPR